MFKALWSLGRESDGAFSVRRAVFVDELGFPDDAEFDALDDYAAHLFVSDEFDVPMAAGRMYPDGERVMIDRIAVMKDFRSLPYDDLVLRTMLYKAQQSAMQYICAAVYPESAGLYTPFGFKETAKTVLRCRDAVLLTVPRNAVIWDSPCKHEHSNHE